MDASEQRTTEARRGHFLFWVLVSEAAMSPLIRRHDARPPLARQRAVPGAGGTGATGVLARVNFKSAP